MAAFVVLALAIYLLANGGAAAALSGICGHGGVAATCRGIRGGFAWVGREAGALGSFVRGR